MEVKSESEVAQLCLTLSNPVDCSPRSPPSMGFSRQEYWSGVPFSSPGDLASLASAELAGRLLTTNATWEAIVDLRL